MGAIRRPDAVKLFVGLLTGVPTLQQQIRRELEENWGSVDLQSPVLAFDFTEYYRRDMGAELQRVFFSFERLIDPGDLAAVKVRTNEIEERHRLSGGAVPRPVNLDPGYLELGKLVLASTKNHCHRIYLGQGIYAEVTLFFRDGEFRSAPWTYPDYQSQAYQQFFRQVRENYRQQLGCRRRAAE